MSEGFNYFLSMLLKAYAKKKALVNFYIIKGDTLENIDT